MLDVAGEDLVVIANTADDVETYGAHVSPDPDLVTFWLADRIDERGWGLRDDTFAVMDALRALGATSGSTSATATSPSCLEPRRRLAEGASPDEALAELAAAIGVPGARAADVRRAGPHTGQGPRRAGAVPGVHDPRRGEGPVEDVDFEGIEAARADREALDAIAARRARS